MMFLPIKIPVIVRTNLVPSSFLKIISNHRFINVRAKSWSDFVASRDGHSEC